MHHNNFFVGDILVYRFFSFFGILYFGSGPHLLYLWLNFLLIRKCIQCVVDCLRFVFTLVSQAEFVMDGWTCSNTGFFDLAISLNKFK